MTMTATYGGVGFLEEVMVVGWFGMEVVVGMEVSVVVVVDWGVYTIYNESCWW